MITSTCACPTCGGTASHDVNDGLCVTCELTRQRDDLKELRLKVNDYNRCHKYSFAEIKYETYGPYIKIHSI